MEKAKLLLTALLFVLVLGLHFVGGCSRTPPPVRVTIVGTNDIHGAVWPVPAFWRNQPDPPPVGGFAALAHYVGRIREENENVLLLDAGDFFQGTPEGNLSLGEIPLLAMNYLGYDALALGNHEFDFGVELVLNLSRKAAFPFLAANMEVIDPRLPDFFRDYAVFDFEGVRILVIGVNTSRLFAMTEPDLESQLAVSGEEDAVRRVMEETAGEWEVCLVLSHIGLERDRELAAAVDGIDFIFGGHSHTGLREPVEVNSTRIVQTYGRNTTAAVLDFEYCRRAGEVTGTDYRLIELDYSEETSDPGMELLLEYATAGIRELMDVEIGRAAHGLSRDRGLPSSPIGSFVADVIQESAGADFAFYNRTGIRKDLPAGPITRRDVFETIPFDNSIVVVEMDGAEVGEMLAYFFRWDNYSYDFSDGVMISLDLAADPDSRVTGVLVGDEPLDEVRGYRVATNSFIAGSLAGRRGEEDPLALDDTGVVVRQAVEDRIASEGKFSYSFTPRVEAKGRFPGDTAPPEEEGGEYHY